MVVPSNAELAFRAGKARGAISCSGAGPMRSSAAALLGRAVATKRAALCQHGAQGARTPVAGRDDQRSEGGVARADGVRRARLAVLGRGGKDVRGRRARVLQVKALEADVAGGARCSTAQPVRARDTLAVWVDGERSSLTRLAVGAACRAGRGARGAKGAAYAAVVGVGAAVRVVVSRWTRLPHSNRGRALPPAEATTRAGDAGLLANQSGIGARFAGNAVPHAGVGLVSTRSTRDA